MKSGRNAEQSASVCITTNKESNMGNARKLRRAGLSNSMISDVHEIIRRLNFLEQMRPKNRNKPRNIRKMAELRKALVRA